MAVNLWDQADHALAYLSMCRSIPQGEAGREALVEWVPADARRLLDLGCGDGLLLDLVLGALGPEVTGVAVDFSPVMLEAARQRFSERPAVEVIDHDLSVPLPDLGAFDAVVSGFAIHHLDHERKRQLYGEVLALLGPGGVFCNLEHVSSSTERLHDAFLAGLGIDPDDDDPSNQLLDVETQLRWLRELGFCDVDCHWKWRELALLAGSKPA